jgi:hypothetical protein
VLLLAREMGVLNMGTIGLDGTKIHANAICGRPPPRKSLSQYLDQIALASICPACWRART